MHDRRALSAFLAFTTLVGATRADGPARLKASWKETDARVIAFSPDGRSVVSSGGDGYQLRDSATGKVRVVLRAPLMGVVHKAAFTPDSRLLFVQVASSRPLPLVVHDVEAWDVASGELRGAFPYVAEHLDQGSFDLSADGRRLALVDNSERLPVKVRTLKLRVFGVGRDEIEIHMNENPGLPRVQVWDVPAWREIAVVDGGLPLAFSPDGKLLATGGRDWRTPVARLWDAETGRFRSELKDRAPGLWPVAVSPDGRFLASDASGAKALWELADGRKWAVETRGTGGSSRGPVFSPDGKLFFPNGLPWMNPHIGQPQEHDCFDLTTMPPGRLDLGPGELIISPDGSRYAAVLGERGKETSLTMVLRDLPSLRESGRLEVNGLVGAGFSPDGRRLALQAWRNHAIPPGPATRQAPEIQLVDPAAARVAITIPSSEQIWGDYNWKFSPDGNSLAVSYRTGSNVVRPGELDPSDRPMNVEIWELPAR